MNIQTAHPSICEQGEEDHRATVWIKVDGDGEIEGFKINLSGEGEQSTRSFHRYRYETLTSHSLVLPVASSHVSVQVLNEI